ncbi:MAG TPA: 2,3-bisphosphoglycerate-independent phosphoglycerate mutase [Pyrinomonadaceae bacterium]|jgi:2,3-bisphosphoglycerate-independent phosphoglycerate mutase|nr:2,3-bisphosphoglycerate-independent phosphoglycerate mutase [Pyrinomonadaceae bacterium]
MIKEQGPLALIILDGFGHSAEREGNAIAMAKMPFYDEIREKYPHTLIEASGTCVGLPANVMGNSEVGHLNMGSGRVIRTDIGRIDYSIASGEMFNSEVLLAAMDNALRRGGALHFIGLLSDGLVHSSQEHLYALLRMAKERGLQKVYVHCFLDGRDTPPMSAYGYVEALQVKCMEIGCGRIASVVGRYHAMDRDKRWERTKLAYDLLVHAEGERAIDPVAAIKGSYERGVTDEFVQPIVVTRETGEPVATISDNDSVISFNYRADRARQITSALAVPGFDGFPVPNRPQVDYVCFTVYDKTFPLPAVFSQLQHHNILADVFAAVGVRNYRLAETEKYAHVTYFFNGGTEREFPGERRLLVPSPKVATYDLEPAMAAFKITDKLLRAIEEGETDVFIVNFANPDMVGHSGNLEKTIEAVQYVDTCLGWITKGLRQAGGRALITSDHGNCEQMIDFKTGQPHTAHTTSLVPFHLIDEDARGVKLREGGALEDVAPTILGMLDVAQPAEMTGRDLREV